MTTVTKRSKPKRKSLAPLVEVMEDRLVLNAPSFTATAVAATQVDVSWVRVSGASLYRVYVEQPSIKLSSPLASVRPRTTSYTVSGLNPGTTYAFDVAYVKGGRQFLEAPQVASTPALPRSTPNAPHVTALTVSTSQIQLMWNPVPNTTDYEIYALTYNSGIEGPQSWKLIGTLPYLDSLGTSPNNFAVVYGLSSGITYTFTVAAENSYGMTTGNLVRVTTD